MAKMGGARTFFTVYASIKSSQILDDANALGATLTAVFTDAIEGMMIAFEEVFMGFEEWNDALIDLAEPIEIARVHFEKFFDEADESVEQLEMDIIGIGAAFNQAADQSLEAAATMAQIGSIVGGPKAQFGATQAAMLLGGVGMMETESAMSAMMQLQMQTDFMYKGISKERRALLDDEQQRTIILKNSIGLVDKLNETENTSGATIQGLIQAMNQYASAATLVNTSLDEQIALGATLIEQGEQSSKAGRSIKQMLARIASDRSGNNALLKEYNVEVRDEYGNMYTLLDVMTQLKPSWDSLNSTQQTNIAISVAGAHHYVRFIKLMEGYDRTLTIMSNSQNSAGSAMEEFGVFMSNDAYRMMQLRKEIDKYNYSTAKVMIPINKDMLEIELVRAKAQYALAGGFKGIGFASEKMIPWLFRGSTAWLHMASTTFAAIKGMMAFVLAVKVLGVAQKTLLAIGTNVSKNQMLINMGKQHEVILNATLEEQEIALQAVRFMGLDIQTFGLEILGEEVLLKGHLVNLEAQKANLLITQAKSLSSANLFRGSGGSMLLNEYTILKEQLMILKVQEGTLRQQIVDKTLMLDVDKAALSQEHIKLTALSMEDDLQRQNHLTRITSLESKIQANNIDIAQTSARLNLLDAEASQYILLSTGVSNYNTMRIVGSRTAMNNKLQELWTEALVIEAIETKNMAKLREIDLDQLKLITQRLLTQGTIGQAEAEGLLSEMTAVRMGIQAKAMQNSMMMMNGLMVASMLVMMFAKGERAAEAGALLMTAAMIPLVYMTISFATATAAAGAGVTAMTGGINLAVAAIISAIAAWLIAGEVDLFGGADIDEDIKKMEEDLAHAEAEYEALMAEMGYSMEDLQDQSDAMSTTFTTDMAEMEDAMASFDDKRLEVFFGGRRSAMDAAMFRELKQTGIENLYFQPELTVTNTFNGVTYEQAADLVAEAIEERLKDTGALQLNQL